MDAGRRWALETFGSYGPQIRQSIAAMVQEEHEASLNAQDASGHRSRSVYGEFWRGILERFEQFGELPGATLVRPGEAPYRIPVVNGVALFPWRFANSRETDLAATPFGTSGARLALANLRLPNVQGVFEIELPETGLSPEEQQLLATFGSVLQHPVVTSGRLVLTAICSSVNGLFSVEWGEVVLRAGGYLDWAGQPESLLSLPPSRPVSTSPGVSFTSGHLPEKFPLAGDEAEPTGND